MTPLVPPTVAAGTDAVNAAALDATLATIVDAINRLIAALGVQRGEDDLIASNSVRWRMFAQRARQNITDLAVQVATIRRQLDPAALNFTLTDKTITSEPFSFYDTDLIGWWKFDENTGVTAADSSDNSNTGTLTIMPGGTALPTWVRGKHNRALDFNGVSDRHRVVCVDDGSLDVTVYTIAAWIKWDGVTGDDRQYIYGNYKDTNRFPHNGVVITMENDSRFRLFHKDNITLLVNAYRLFSAQTIPTGTWVHVVATMDAARNAAIYVNGKLSSTGVADQDAEFSNAVPVIGANFDNWLTPGTIDRFNGAIDDVRVYNRALSAAEVWTLYTGPPRRFYGAPNTDTAEDTTIPFVIGGDSSLLYRVRFRVRSMCGLARAVEGDPSWTQQHPFTAEQTPAFTIPTDVPEYQNAVTLAVTNPPRNHLLTYSPAPADLDYDYALRAVPRDFIYEVVVYGGTTLELRGIAAADGTGQFCATANYPPDDDPRFPALYRFPAGQTAQIDLLAIVPWQDDPDAILTQAGFPITTEAPTEALYA